VDAWTLDMDRLDLASRMVESGVDYITTNQLPEMAALLKIQSERWVWNLFDHPTISTQIDPKKITKVSKNY
jgi:hypothetical protein